MSAGILLYFTFFLSEATLALLYVNEILPFAHTSIRSLNGGFAV